MKLILRCLLFGTLVFVQAHQKQQQISVEGNEGDVEEEEKERECPTSVTPSQDEETEAPQSSLSSYEYIEALLHGMNQETISYDKALNATAWTTSQNDPVRAAFAAYCYCTKSKSSPFPIHESVWTLAMQWGLEERATTAACPFAQYLLGFGYDLGWGGVPKDLTLAREWYAKAAQQGVATAQFALGLLATKQGDPNQLYYYNQAAAQGHARAELALGALYLEEKDFERARIYYQRAASQGSPEAQMNLGLLYKDGLLLDDGHEDCQNNDDKHQTSPKDHVDRAHQYLEDASKSGYRLPQFNFANVLQQRGDYDKAHEVYTLAALQGHKGALYNLVQMCNSGNVSDATLQAFRERAWQELQEI